MKPKGAPTVLYWVEARYHEDRAGRPMGGKFTRYDMAQQRRDKIREDGGSAKLYISDPINWKEMPNAKSR